MVDLSLKYSKILLILLISGFISLDVKNVKAVENVNDPFESVNRNIFKFNNFSGLIFFLNILTLNL